LGVNETTPRERLLAALRMEEPDVVPVYAPADLSWYGAETDFHTKGFLGKTEINCSLDLAGWETFRIFFGNLGTSYSSDVVGCGEGYTTVKRVIETPKGLIRSLVRRSDQIYMQPWTIERFAKSEDDVERFLSIPYEPYDATGVERDFEVEYEVDLRTYRDLEAKIGENGLVSVLIPDPIMLLFTLCGIEFAVKMYYRNFGLVEELFRIGLERVLDYVEQLLSLGVHYFVTVGPEYVGTVMPHLFDKLMVPYDRKIVSAIHEKNGIAEIHCHGKVNNWLERFAATGADALDPLEPPPTGDIQDLGDAKKRIGDRVCLVGNVSYKELRNKASTERAVHGRIESAAEGGGYVLCVVYSPIRLREGIPPDIPPHESVVEFVKTARRYGKYPIKIIRER